MRLPLPFWCARRLRLSFLRAKPPPPVPCSYDIPTTLVSDPLFPFLDHILCMRPSDGLTHCSPPPSPLRVLLGPWRWGLGERRRSSGLDPRVALALPLWSGHPGMTLLARLLEIERIPIAALNLRSAALESRPPPTSLCRDTLWALPPPAPQCSTSRQAPPSKSLRAPSVFSYNHRMPVMAVCVCGTCCGLLKISPRAGSNTPRQV